MAGKLRHWKEKDGRFYARIAVPEAPRPHLDRPRSELIEPLGGDRRMAVRLHPGAVARLQHELAMAERKANLGTAKPITRFPMTSAQMASAHYQKRLAYDLELRNDVRYSFGYVDDLLVRRLWDAIAGKLADDDLFALAGS